MKKFLDKYEITAEMVEQLSFTRMTLHNILNNYTSLHKVKYLYLVELQQVTGASWEEINSQIGHNFPALKQCPQPIPYHIQSEQNSYYYEVEKYISKGQHHETWTRISNALDHHGHPIYKKIPYADIPSYGLVLHSNEKITKLEYEKIIERRNRPLNIIRRKKSK